MQFANYWVPRLSAARISNNEKAALLEWEGRLIRAYQDLSSDRLMNITTYYPGRNRRSSYRTDKGIGILDTTAQAIRAHGVDNCFVREDSALRMFLWPELGLFASEQVGGRNIPAEVVARIIEIGVVRPYPGATAAKVPGNKPCTP